MLTESPHLESERDLDVSAKEVSASAMGQALKTIIEEHGSITYDQAREWIAENYQGAKPLRDGYINLVASYGYSGKRKYWHKVKDDDGLVWLVWGAKPTAKPEELDRALLPPLDDASRNAMEDLQRQFQTLGEKLGISTKAASSAAEYVTRNYDLYSPEAVWNGLRKCTQVFPSLRKLWWETWMNHTNTDVPSDLAALVNRSATELGGVPKAPSPAALQSRRWLAIDGDVLATYLEDPEGMTMSEARILASEQRQRQRERVGAAPPERDESTLVALLHEHGETERARLAMSQPPAVTGASDVQTLMQLQDARIEALRKESDARIESIRKEAEVREEARSRESALREEMRTKELTGHLDRMQQDNRHVVEMLQQSHQHELEALTSAIERLDARKSSNFVTELDSVIPGLGTRMVDKFLSPGPAAEDPNIALKREGLEIIRNNLPGFLQVGHDIARATDRLARVQYEEPEGQVDAGPMEPEELVPEPVQKSRDVFEDQPRAVPAHVVLPCVECGVSGITQPPPGIDIVVCPACQVVQSLSGIVYTPVPQEPPLVGPPAPAVSPLETTVPLVITPSETLAGVEAPTQEPVHAG